MPHSFPRPDTLFPIQLPDGSTHPGTVFLQTAVDHPRLTVGAYTYASADKAPDDWATALAPYLYPGSPERLIIGKFCQIAHGVEFITASANHRFDGFSSFPFAVFDGGFAEDRPSLPKPGKDTVIGNDVWIGRGARILPGAHLGDGVIVGAGAVVAGDVPSYSIVAGNPARQVRRRFAPEICRQLSDIAWWDWPIEHILAHEGAICGGDINALARAAMQLPPNCNSD